MNILDYVKSEQAPFAEKPLCAVDTLVLSEACMIDFPEVALGSRPSSQPFRAFDPTEERYPGLQPDNSRALLAALAESPRFASVRVGGFESVFDEESGTQFAGMAFEGCGEIAFVGFRGTDNSIAGWREDFLMACTWPIPSQSLAARYLEHAAASLPGPLVIGGHSKGGNLATYATAKAPDSVRERIIRVYSFDGPGFKPRAFSEEDRARLGSRVEKYVPADSIIGLILESEPPHRIVSTTARGLEAHDAFSWRIDPKTAGVPSRAPEFAYEAQLTQAARFTDRVLDAWIARYTDEELALIVDAIFAMIEATGAENFTELFASGQTMVSNLLEAARNTPSDARRVLLSAAKDLSETALRQITEP